MLMALATSLVVLLHCCVTADILTKLLQQCFLFFIGQWSDELFKGPLVLLWYKDINKGSIKSPALYTEQKKKLYTYLFSHFSANTYPRNLIFISN